MAINSLSAASKGFSGLASGIDTESIVKSMLSGTQSKIDSQNQKKTQLEYKQELYRSVISDLQKFQSTYFSYTNQASNLLSQAFFESKSASTTSKSYTVTATSSATAGNVTIKSITSLATNFKQTAKNAASAKIAGAVDTDKLDALKAALTDENEKLTFKIGAETVDVKMGDLAGKSSLAVRNTLSDALQGKATVEYVNGSFTIKATDADAAFSITGSDTALKLVGGAGVSGTGGASFKMNTDAVLPTLSVTIDGTTKSITFNPLNSTSAADLASQLNSAVSSAFGAGIIVSESTDNPGTIIFKAATNEDGTDNNTRKITISGNEETMGALGLKKSVSNKIALNTAVGSNYFATPVIGQRQEFTINGVDFSFSSDQTISSIMNAINSSAAGVKISYSSTTDTFSLEATSSGKRGDDYSFEISQSEGNLMTAMFGVAPSGNTTGATLTKSVMTSAVIPAGDFLFEGGTVNLNVNGDKVSLTIPSAYTSAEELVDAINNVLAEQFGKDEDDHPNVLFALSEDGKSISLDTADGYTAHMYDNSLSALGFNTKVTGSATLAELGITEKIVFNFKDAADPDAAKIEIDVNMTIDDMITAIKEGYSDAGGSSVDFDVSFDETRAYIRICGVDIPMDFIDVSGKLFGQTEGSLNAQGGVTEPLMTVNKGSNAIVEINGVTVERNTNSFTVDGVSLTLLSETNESSTITVTQNTDVIYDTIIKFVDDYNTLINSMNQLLDADPTYKKYPPLTTAQEDEMSESQIEKWEEKSKEGLLRNDNTLSSVLSSLRRSLYTKPEGSLALYDLGITTSYFGTKDNMAIPDTGKLKTLISENPEAIMKLFTDPETGLATMLNKALGDATRTTPTNPGSLVRIAGAAGKTDTTSNIYKQVKDIKDNLGRLENRYQNEYERYWKQFNAMESLISNMNSTSSWLTSMMSSSW